MTVPWQIAEDLEVYFCSFSSPKKAQKFNFFSGRRMNGNDVINLSNCFQHLSLCFFLFLLSFGVVFPHRSNWLSDSRVPWRHLTLCKVSKWWAEERKGRKRKKKVSLFYLLLLLNCARSCLVIFFFFYDGRQKKIRSRTLQNQGPSHKTHRQEGKTRPAKYGHNSRVVDLFPIITLKASTSVYVSFGIAFLMGVRELLIVFAIWLPKQWIETWRGGKRVRRKEWLQIVNHQPWASPFSQNGNCFQAARASVQLEGTEICCNPHSSTSLNFKPHS